MFFLSSSLIPNVLGQNLISGTILASNTDEIVKDAVIIHVQSNRYAISNETGFYLLSVPSGKSRIELHHMAYDDQVFEVEIKSDTTINLVLKPHEIPMITIIGEQSLRDQTLLGKIIINPATISSLPSFAGEPDLVKGLTMLPGVLPDNKGFSNMYVRGGGRQNNLFLIDGSPLYLSNHAWGFLSPFNLDMIRTIDFYKGGFPARFGGKTASIVDIATRDGNKQKHKQDLQIGLLQSKILLEGPLIADKTSYILGFRASYLDALLWPVRIWYSAVSKPASFFGYTFWDVNMKVTHQFNPKNKAFISFYHGYDNQKVYDQFISKSDNYETRFKYKQYNSLLTAGFQSNISKRSILQVSANLSSYGNSYSTDFSIIAGLGNFSNSQLSSSRIQDLSLNTRFIFQPANNHVIRAGNILKRYQIYPRLMNFAVYEPTLDTVLNFGTGNLANCNELVFYVEDEWNVSKNISVNIGTRYNIFQSVDSTFQSIEPRLSVRFALSKNLTLKLGATVMEQQLQVLENNLDGIGSELWLPCSKTLPPQKANQVSAGFFGQISKWDIEYGLEAYYKLSNNLVAFFYNEPDEIIDVPIEELVLNNGIGKSYGTEFMIKHSGSGYSVQLSYTLSWCNHKFTEINNGEWYPYLYDRRHNISLVGQYFISDDQKLSFNFVFNSGTPVTLPEGYFPGNELIDGFYLFNGYNKYRLPPYHRLDIAYSKSWISKKGRSCEFMANLYNAYLSKNPIQLYFSQNQIKKISMFLIIPSFSYRISF